MKKICLMMAMMLIAMCSGVGAWAEAAAETFRIAFTESNNMYCSQIAVTDEVGTYTYVFDFNENTNLTEGTRDVASSEDAEKNMTLNATGTFRYQSGYGFQVAQNNYVEFPAVGGFSAVVTISYAGDATGVLVLSKDGKDIATNEVAKSGSKADYTLTYSAPGSPVEASLIKTSFENWEGYATEDKGTATSKDVKVTTKKTKEEITFTLTNCSVNPNAGGKVSAMSDGNICAAKQSSDATKSTIETSVFANVTSVSYYHRATGSSRGWGLEVKGDGDEDWVKVSTTTTDSNGSTVNVNVNRKNVKLRWYNLAYGQYAALSNLEIKGMFTPAVRTFKDFVVDLTTSDVVLPTGVTKVSYSDHGATYKDSQHGWQWYAVKFDVDGPVNISLGGCSYANETGKVVDAKGNVLGTIDTKSATCPTSSVIPYASWVYNVEEAGTLTVYCGQYCPSIKVEACEYAESVDIEYYNQDGKKLGAKSVLPDEPLAFAYSSSDLTIPTGKAFRGWYTGVGKKIEEGTKPGKSLKLYAKVTAIESTSVGSIFNYDLKNQYFYMDEHECISNVGGAWHDDSHGWLFASGNKLVVPVAGKAYIQLGLCKYSAKENITVTTSKGDEVATFSAYDASCGNHSFFYDGEAGELNITFAGNTYISKVDVYNVESAVKKDEQTGYYNIPANDGAAFVLALLQLQDGEKIFLPNGTYDLGEKALTTISASNVSIIGQSMEGVTIKNWLPVEKESINGTATIVITGTNVYLQDLTIQNTLDYYSKSDGRAVAMWDKGTHTICKNVRLLSYQDTYYSNKPGQVNYFEGGSIHGTVDFLCGEGSVYFNGVELYCEKRKLDGSGSDCITANSAKDENNDFGYIFESCTIKSECSVISLGRAWNNQPRVAYINTILDYSAGNFTLSDSKINRWTLACMNDPFPALFGEYNTMNVSKQVISPATNVIAFTNKSGNTIPTPMETILTDAQAESLSYTSVMGSWDPAKETVQETLEYTVEGGVATWSTTTATVFLKETSTGVELLSTLPATIEEGASYRAANSRGGFGPVAVETGSSTSIGSIDADQKGSVARKYFLNGQVVIEKDGVKYDILGKRL